MISQLPSQKTNKSFKYEAVADPGGLFSKSPDLSVNSIPNLNLKMKPLSGQIAPKIENENEEDDQDQAQEIDQEQGG